MMAGTGDILQIGPFNLTKGQHHLLYVVCVVIQRILLKLSTPFVYSHCIMLRYYTILSHFASDGQSPLFGVPKQVILSC